MRLFDAVPIASHRGNHRAVVTWLFGCCALVFIMICVGGITRLTHSGLSIVEWQPIVGAIPPLNEAQWDVMFEKYRATPEYRQVNRGMSLAEFKGIFWWEYSHRLLGRLIGLAFLLPFLWFAWTGRIRRSDLPKMIGLFALGGLQGAMGWYMVASGLVDDPRVSHLRLTAHLGLAVVIYAAMLWVALDLLGESAQKFAIATGEGRLWKLSLSINLLIFIMILSGGLVAGLRAGYAYNTFPLMNGHWMPPDLMLLDPWYLNLVNNITTVQFNHRLLATLILLGTLMLWFLASRTTVSDRTRMSIRIFVALMMIQIGIGIATLLYVVPVPLAALHQACAVLVLTASLIVTHGLRSAGR